MTTGLDGVLHSIGFAPQTAWAGRFLDGPWEDVATTVHVRAYSFKSLATAALPLLTAGGVDRRHGLRRPPGVAGLRLDGRGQGRRWSR